MTYRQKNSFIVREDRMIKYAEAFEKAKEDFTKLVLQQISQEDNCKANKQTKMASSWLDGLRRILLCRKLNHWQFSQILGWVIILPAGKYFTCRSEHNRFSSKADPQCFILVEGMLSKRSLTRPLLRCLGPIEVEYVLREIHERCCENHLRGQELARKAILASTFGQL